MYGSVLSVIQHLLNPRTVEFQLERNRPRTDVNPRLHSSSSSQIDLVVVTAYIINWVSKEQDFVFLDKKIRLLKLNFKLSCLARGLKSIRKKQCR